MSALSATGWGPTEILPAAGPLIIGRDPSCGAVLGHPAVSRQHAELRLDSGRLLVRDLGSRCGTSVNWKRVQESPLGEGDHVEFGAVIYEVHGGRLLLLAQQEQGLALEARGLAIERGGQLLLSNVQLSVKPGQFVGLLGPSGSGKSTLLKCLAGLLPSAEGTLLIDDQLELPAGLESYRPLVGYVPQDDLIHDNLSARENLGYAALLRLGGLSQSLSQGERQELVTTTLTRLGLSEHGDKRAGVLSGGQRKRLNVAFELLSRPRALFLDEPTSGLDPAAETALMRLLKGLAERGVTVVCATHVMENLGLFDQVVVLAQRTVVHAGPPGQLLARFQAASHAELYEKLEAGGDKVSITTPEREKQRPGRGVDEVLRGVALVKVKRPEPPPPPRIKLGWQVGVQFLRGLHLIARDRALLVLLVGQPLGIGLLINLSQVNPDNIKPLITFAVVTAIWLGLNSTAREVVQNRRIYVRERMLGITPEGFILSRMLLFSVVGLAQVLLLVLVLRQANFLPADKAQDLAAWSLSYLLLVFWVTYLSGMVLGLLISTLASSQEAAVALLPLLVLPQLLLTGVATGFHAHTGGNGSFGPLLQLVEKAGGNPPRGVKGWAVELASLPLYSRPATALLSEGRPATTTPRRVGVLVDWLHLLFLLALTSALLVLVLRWREGQWLRQS
jgi:ABC-type multidrug transport system ATPase subunit